MKAKTIYRILKIIVVLGWLAFFFYDLHLIRYLGKEYNRDPSNFVFFDDEQHREAYKSRIVYGNTDWISQAALVDQCKPMIYFRDLYFNKIDTFIKLAGLLILLTLIIRIAPKEWKDLKNKVEKFGEKFGVEDDELDKKT